MSLLHTNNGDIIKISKASYGRYVLILQPWLDTGLLTSKGDKWHSRRKILTPTFHFNILRQFVDILIEESERMTQKLKNIDGTVEIDVTSFVSEHTLNAICETAMGTSLHGLSAAQGKISTGDSTKKTASYK